MRTHRLATALATAAALALTACGDAGSSPATTSATTGDGADLDAGGDAGEVTTLRFLFFGGPEEKEAYERVAAAFEEAEPGVEVELQVVAKQDDLLARLTTSFAAGNPPDVFLINFRKYGLYAEQGVLQPIGPLLEGSGVDTAGYFQAPLDAFRFDGTELTCLPQNVSSLVTYVNLDLFEVAGVAPPTGDWTWSEFLAAAEALTGLDPDGDGSPSFGIGTEPKLIRLAPMVWSAGGEVVDDPDAPTRLAVESPAWEAALDFLTTLPSSGVAPGDLETQARDAEARFLDGDLAMFWSSRREVPTFRTITDFAWDVAPFPVADADAVDGGPGERVTMLHSDAFCLARDGQVDAAFAFVEFALGQVGATILAESGRTVPSNRAVAESAAFLRTDVPPASARVFLDNAEIVRATPSTADWNALEKQADDILEALYFGRIDRATALERLAALRLGTGG